MPLEFTNPVTAADPLPVPCYLLKGYSDTHDDGLIEASCVNVPTQYYEVTQGYFKVYVRLFFGHNHYKLRHIDGEYSDEDQEFHPGDIVYDETEMTLNYQPFENYVTFKVPIVRFFILTTMDSPFSFDCPGHPLASHKGLETVKQKMRTVGRLLQMFTLDLMERYGYGKRCFRFEEEGTVGDGGTQIKVIRTGMDMDVERLRDPANKGYLKQVVVQALRRWGLSENDTGSTPAMTIVVLPYTLGLGMEECGSFREPIKYAICGSQGLSTWPSDWSEIHRCFTDCTKMSMPEVAGFPGCSGTNWECCTHTIGRLFSLLGGLFGAKSEIMGNLGQVEAIDRMFLSKERKSLYGNQSEWGPVLERDEPMWGDLDPIRFLYHPAFSLRQDFRDHQFKIPSLLFNQGMKVPDRIDPRPNFYVLDRDTVDIVSGTGIYLLAFSVNGEIRTGDAYPPAQYDDGMGPQRHVRIKYSVLEHKIGPLNGPLGVEVLSIGFGENTIPDLREFLDSHCHGDLCKTELFGADVGRPEQALFPSTEISKLRVSHGTFTDGIDAFFGAKKMVRFGNCNERFGILEFLPGERVEGMVILSGAYVDGFQFLTNKRESPHYGGYGGNFHRLILPPGYSLRGFYGSMGSWCNQLGLIYSKNVKELSDEEALIKRLSAM